MKRGLNSANRAMSKLANGVKRGAVVIAAGLAVTTGAMANVISTGAGFEQAIVNVGAVSLKTRDQIADLEKQALELGRTTKFTSTQAANAMEIMAKAGFTQQDILKATPAVLSAAAASGMEIAETANIVSNALKGMGLETSEAARVADVLALASTRTNSTIGSLGDSLSLVSESARRLKIPLEEVVSAVALMQDVGLPASVAGSAMNTMLNKMAAPSTKMEKKMKKLGISFEDTEKNMLPLTEVLAQFAKGAGTGNMEQIAFFAELVGLRGAKAAGVLADMNKAGKLSDLTEQLKNAKGVAEKMAVLRMSTFEGSMLLLGSAVDAVKVKIFGLNSGPLKDTVDLFTAWVSANEDLIATKIGGFLGAIVENIVPIASAIFDIGKGIVAFIALSLALKGIAATLTLINLIMAANPIVLAIMAAVAAVALLSGALDPVLEMVKAIGSGIKGLFNGVKSFTSAIGFGDDSDSESERAQQKGTAAQMISPGERTAKSIEEKRSTSTSEVTIKDDTGRAEVTKGELGPMVKLQTSGGF
jgi:TP901 family phage tail tape measure protein